jgi:phage terminase small subunit
MANHRKSLKDHQMSGTFRKDRHEGRNELEWTKLEDAPEPPDYFDEHAREAWGLITKELLERNDLCTVYLSQLEQYCYNVCLAKRATTHLDKALTTPSQANPAVSPYFRIYTQACKTIMDIGDKFGFNSKSKLSIPGTADGTGKPHKNPSWDPYTIRHKYNMDDPKEKEEWERICQDYEKMYPLWLMK